MISLYQLDKGGTFIMIKKLFSCFLVSCFIFLPCGNALNIKVRAESVQNISSKATLDIGNSKISSDPNIIYENSNSIVMVSLNSVYDKLLEKSSLSTNHNNVTLKNPHTTIELQNGNKKIISNSTSIYLETAPEIKNDVIYVPLEFFSKVLNKTINWNFVTKTAKICTPYENKETYFKNSNQTNDTRAKLDNYLTLLQQNENFHGSVLVAQNGNIILDKGYGKSDFSQNIDNSPKTEFPIGSMTKQFTALSIMQLVERGLLSENDPLSKFIPDYPNGNSITIKNLLTHTSGIVNYTNLPEFWSMNTDSVKDINKVIDLFKNKPLEFKPGSQFSYSNSGYTLLSYIITKVTGMSYIDYFKKNIFAPLDMKNTGMSYNGEDKLYTSSGYTGYLDVFPVNDQIDLNGCFGAGSLYSTTEDLYKWDRALYTNKLLKSENLKKIFTGYIEMGKYQPSYGYGWMITDGKLGKQIYHGGNVLGFTSNISRYPEKDMTIIILTNLGNSILNKLNDTLADISTGYSYSLPEPKNTINLDKKIIEKYTGTYKLQENSSIFTIKSDGNHLYYEINNEKYELLPQTAKKFYMREADAQFEFLTDGKGNPHGIKIYQYDSTFIADKEK